MLCVVSSLIVVKHMKHYNYYLAFKKAYRRKGEGIEELREDLVDTISFLNENDTEDDFID